MGLIYLDTSIMIHAVETEALEGDLIRERLAQEAEHEFAYSPLVRLECMVLPIRNHDSALRDRYEAAMARLQDLPITDETFRVATGLRAQFNLKTPDAIHLATARIHRCVSLWTKDNRLATASQGLAINILRDA